VAGAIVALLSAANNGDKERYFGARPVRCEQRHMPGIHRPGGERRMPESWDRDGITISFDLLAKKQGLLGFAAEGSDGNMSWSSGSSGRWDLR